jgi:putative transposase
VHPEADGGIVPGTTSAEAARIAELEREMKVAYIDQYKNQFGVQPICDVLAETDAPIAPGTYYAALGRPPSARGRRDEELTEEIRRIHTDNYAVYGARKVHAALVREGATVARCTVERLMRRAGLRGVIRARSPRTTRPAPETDRPADLVERQFTATAPNQLWVADITYIRTFSGWVYAAFVIEVFSRMVVGWQVATSLYTELALDALEMGIWRRRRTGADLAGPIHHSDRGVQYRALRYTERLAEAAAVASVGSKGDSYDNALAEAFNSLFKAEPIRNKGPWTGINDVEIAVAEYRDPTTRPNPLRHSRKPANSLSMKPGARQPRPSRTAPAVHQAVGRGRSAGPPGARVLRPALRRCRRAGRRRPGARDRRGQRRPGHRRARGGPGDPRGLRRPAGAVGPRRTRAPAGPPVRHRLLLHPPRPRPGPRRLTPEQLTPAMNATLVRRLTGTTTPSWRGAQQEAPTHEPVLEKIADREQATRTQAEDVRAQIDQLTDRLGELERGLAEFATARQGRPRPR